MGTKGSQRNAVAEALLVFTLVACLYLPLLSRQFDLNGIDEAAAVESGDLFKPNHLLYRPLGLTIGRLAEFLGFTGRSIDILQVLSALSGAASVGLAHLFFRTLGCSRFVSAVAAFWLATTWAHWAFSTDAMYISVGAFFVTAAGVALLREGRVTAILSGALLGLAVTTWQANVLLVPLFMTGMFLFRAGTRTASVRLALHFAWSCLLPIVGFYLVAAQAAHIQTLAEFWGWITSHDGGAELPMWGAFDWSRVGIGAKTVLNSIIFVPLATGSWRTAEALAFPLVLLALALVVRPTLQWRVLAWLMGGYLIFIPFVVWWDPWEAKWLFVGNIFLAASFAQLLRGLVAGRSVNVTKAANAGVIVLVVLAGAANFPVIRDRHYQRNTNLEMSRCVASHMQPNDIFIATDWSWGGYLGYYFNRKNVSVIEWSAVLGRPTATMSMVSAKVNEVQATHGDAYMVDMTAYPEGHIAWLEAQTRLRKEDFDRYQGDVAFHCEGVGIRRIPLIEDRYELSLSANEVKIGEKYKLTISNAVLQRVALRYRLNGGPIKQFVAELGPEGSVEYDVGPSTEKGLYEFLSFQVAGHIAWTTAGESIRVR
jgi:hypothetical protein